MGYRLELEHPDGRTATIGADTTEGVEFDHRYNAESEFTASVPYDVRLLDWELATVNIYYVFPDSSLFHKFRGEVERVKGNYAQGSMTVYGPGVEHELTKGVVNTVIQNETTENALRNYYSTHLSHFEWNVVPPSPNPVASGDNVQNADSTAAWDGIVSAPATEPYNVTNGLLEPLQTSWTFEMEENDGGFTQGNLEHISCSSGLCSVIFADFADPSYNFSTGHTIPEDRVGMHLRYGHQYIDYSSPNFLAWEGGGIKVTIDGKRHLQFADGFSAYYSPQQGKLKQLNRAKLDDGGTNTDQTDRANSDSAGDVTLLPSDVEAGDAFYVGMDGDYDEIEVELTQEGGGDYSVVWEVYVEEVDTGDGDVEEWREIPDVNDGTNGFRESGSVTWDLEDIATDTPNGGHHTELDSVNVGGDREEYVRARVTSADSMDTQPLASRIRARSGPFRRYTADSWSEGDLSAGSHTFKLEATQNMPSNFLFDVGGVYDSKYTYTFDNSLNAESGYFDGPEPFPDRVPVVLEAAEVPYNINAADVQLTEANGRSVVEVAVSPDDGSTWQTASGTNSHKFTIDTATTKITPRITLGRYGSTSGQTPLQGVYAHSVDVYDLLLDGNDLGVIEELELTGNHLENIKAIVETSDYRFVMDHEPDTLRIESFPSDTKKELPDLTVKNRLPSTDVGGYANKVHVFGAKDADGTRPYAVVQDDGEIADVGVEPVPLIAPDLTTVTDVKNKARTELTRRVSKRRNAGELEVVAKHPLPGYTYDVDLTGNGETEEIPLESVTFSESAGESDGQLKFEDLLGVELEVAAAKRTTRNISALL